MRKKNTILTLLIAIILLLFILLILLKINNNTYFNNSINFNNSNKIDNFSNNGNNDTKDIEIRIKNETIKLINTDIKLNMIFPLNINIYTKEDEIYLKKDKEKLITIKIKNRNEVCIEAEIEKELIRIEKDKIDFKITKKDSYFSNNIHIYNIIYTYFNNYKMISQNKILLTEKKIITISYDSNIEKFNKNKKVLDIIFNNIMLIKDSNIKIKI